MTAKTIGRPTSEDTRRQQRPSADNGDAAGAAAAAAADDEHEQALAPPRHGFAYGGGSHPYRDAGNGGRPGPGAFAVDGIGGRPTRRAPRRASNETPTTGEYATAGHGHGSLPSSPRGRPPPASWPEVDFVVTATLVREADDDGDLDDQVGGGGGPSVISEITTPPPAAVVPGVDATAVSSRGAEAVGAGAGSGSTSNGNGLRQVHVVPLETETIVEAKPVPAGCWSRRAAVVVAIVLLLALAVVLGVVLSSGGRESDNADNTAYNNIDKDSNIKNNDNKETEATTQYAEICHPDSDPAQCGCTVQPANNRQAVIRQADYRGSINYTATGIACQRWDVQEPHPHVYAEQQLYDVFPELVEN